MKGLSVLIPVAPVGGSFASCEFVDTQDDFLVPRLVAKIAELEQRLNLHDESSVSSEDSLVGRLTQSLKLAQDGLDSIVSYIVGENDVEKALTQEATAKSLIIAIRKVGSLKEEATRLANELTAAQETEIAQQAQIELLQTQLAEAKTQLNRSIVLSNALRSSLVKTDTELKAVKDELATTKAAADTMRHEAEVMQRQFSTIQASNLSALSEIEALRASKKTATQELHATQTKLQKAQAVGEDFQRRFLQERAKRRENGDGGGEQGVVSNNGATVTKKMGDESIGGQQPRVVLKEVGNV